MRAYRDVIGVELARPFDRITYKDAMARYGSDKPERRIALEIVELSDALAKSEFKVFAGALASGGVVRGLPIPDAAALTRSELDRLERPGARLRREGPRVGARRRGRQLAVADREVPLRGREGRDHGARGSAARAR